MKEKHEIFNVIIDDEYKKAIVEKSSLLDWLVRECMVSSYDSIRAREYPEDHKLGIQILEALNAEVLKITCIEMSDVEPDISIKAYTEKLGKKISDKKLLELKQKSRLEEGQK